jgi:hypothetical protein
VKPPHKTQPTFGHDGAARTRPLLSGSKPLGRARRRAALALKHERPAPWQRRAPAAAAAAAAAGRPLARQEAGGGREAGERQAGPERARQRVERVPAHGRGVYVEQRAAEVGGGRVEGEEARVGACRDRGPDLGEGGKGAEGRGREGAAATQGGWRGGKGKKALARHTARAAAAGRAGSASCIARSCRFPLVSPACSAATTPTWGPALQRTPPAARAPPPASLRRRPRGPPAPGGRWHPACGPRRGESGPGVGGWEAGRAAVGGQAGGRAGGAGVRSKQHGAQGPPAHKVESRPAKKRRSKRGARGGAASRRAAVSTERQRGVGTSGRPPPWRPRLTAWYSSL